MRSTNIHPTNQAAQEEEKCVALQLKCSRNAPAVAFVALSLSPTLQLRSHIPSTSPRSYHPLHPPLETDTNMFTLRAPLLLLLCLEHLHTMVVHSENTFPKVRNHITLLPHHGLG